MADKQPMSESELLALIEQEEAQALSSIYGKLTEQRRLAMQYYYGEPYGNEMDGRSQVVTTEVKDAVEAAMPSIMSIFTSSDEIVRFEPQGPEDEAAAQQATDYINYIFTRENNGYLVLYCLVKDALLLKNGFCKAYWEDYEDNHKESYEGLVPDELAILGQDPELELTQATKNDDGTYDAVFRRSKKYGRVCIDPVPPEEVLVSRGTRNSLDSARFVEHRTPKTISEIREMGYDIEDNIADYAPNSDFNMEKYQRESYDDAYAYTPDKGNNDPATRRVWFCQAYLNVDFDKDGYAEFRRITKVGRKVLENIEFDSHELLGGTAILMPHKYYGMGAYDLIGDLQLQKSTIVRQLFDNAYNINNGRYAVLDGMANMEDLLTSRPGGIVRMKAMNAVTRMDTPVLSPGFFSLLEYVDKMKQNRIGMTDFPQGVDPDVLNAKATVAEIYKTSSQERLQLMARTLAETAIKEIFWKILELVSKHQQKPKVVKLRNQWVQVDPREWHNKFNMTVTVGLGTGSQQQLLNGISMLGQMQAGMMQAGLMGQTVTPQNIYELAHRAAKAVFPKDAQAFFNNPATQGTAQPQPNPDLLKVQAGMQKAQMSNQTRQTGMILDIVKHREDMQHEAAMEQMGAVHAHTQAVQDQQNRREGDIQKLVHEHVQNGLMSIVDQMREDQRQANERHMQQLQHIHELHKHQMELANRPKKVIRDANGRVSGVTAGE